MATISTITNQTLLYFDTSTNRSRGVSRDETVTMDVDSFTFDDSLNGTAVAFNQGLTIASGKGIGLAATAYLGAVYPNNSGGNLAAGTLVATDVNATLQVIPADATSGLASAVTSQVLGVVVGAIPNGSSGRVSTAHGIPVDVVFAENVVVGDIGAMAYLDTAGKATKVQPSGFYVIEIGTIHSVNAGVGTPARVLFQPAYGRPLVRSDAKGVDVIGSSGTPATIGAAYVAQAGVTDTRDYETATWHVTITSKGTGPATRVDMKIEWSEDGTNLSDLGIEALGSGVAALSVWEGQFDITGETAPFNLPAIGPFPVAAPSVKVSVKVVGAADAKGYVRVWRKA